LIEEAGARFPALPRLRACQLLEVNPGSYYRAAGRARMQGEIPSSLTKETEGTVLREEIERITLSFPAYGYRRVRAQLQRDGLGVNHKRVLRVMGEESLLCQLKRSFVKTPDSEHGLRVYPNLLAQAGWRQLTGINQAWAGDITYVRLREEFVYLAVLLDAFSRRVVGWSLWRSIDAALVLAALEKALAEREPPSGWIHHSDPGVQYACREYVERVLEANGRISMSAKGTPRDNAQVERFMRTLKQEEVYLQEYEGYPESEEGIGQFIEAVYNQKRLHSALGYRPPAEFEQLCAMGLLV
jgi:transposase InsO family protein